MTLKRLYQVLIRPKTPHHEEPTSDVSDIWPLPTGQHAAWIQQARTMTPFVCDAMFMLEPDFYIGPSNGFTKAEWTSARIQLPSIDIPRQFPESVTTAEGLDREDALIDYYRRIVQAAVAHGRQGSLKPFPYFRTKPAVIANGQVITNFAWNDDLYETRSILQHLVESAEPPARLLHVDEDQGWHIHIATSGTATYLVEWEEGSTPPASRGYAFDSLALAGQAASALDRLQTIHRRLVEALGKDYWV